MIKIYNRKTQQYEIEKVAGGTVLNALYNSPIGKVGLELLVKRKAYSALTGILCDMGVSAKKIKSFIEDFNINMSESIQQAVDFKSFNEFFIRKLKPEARVFDADPDLLPAPGDGRLSAWTNIDINKLVQVKGMEYSLRELLLNDPLAAKYKEGTCLILRLAPVDYHRFHFLDHGVCTESKKINGCYYSVNPVALSSITKVFCQNKREYSVLKSENFGDVLYMEVGATSVGSIVQTYKPGIPVKKGEEKGYFKFGGSTVILFFEKGTVKLDQSILEQTNLGFETRVLAGETIGKKY
ncbi:MAG: phosphatidylserine decarboxylase [Clostridia bacterium]|nr:phosphatidylserine decarboxylase [Clostridia bacterium]